MTSRSILVGQDQSKSAMGLKLLMPQMPQPPLQAAAGAFGGFGLGQLFEDLTRRPARLGGARQEVVQLRGHGAQADLLELSAQVIDSGHRRARVRASSS